ncbi:hypothetical protein PBRA_003762 [Plasmodiophora brassicae]|nr:hypothetical protein PBRA_003762 [Plasmodiophora brassicae]
MTEESRAEIQEFITTAQRSPSETSRRGSGDSSAEDVSKQDRKEAIPVSISDQETVAVTPSPADEVDTISPTPPAPPPPPPPPSSVPAPPPPPVPPPVGGVLSVGPMLPPGAVACRPFYWNKLPVTDTPSSNVIWNRLSSVSIARKTIEANFSKKPKLKASVRQRPSIVSPSASQPAKAELPDTQFSQRLDIVLHKLPPVDDVIRALRDLDETVLDLTTLRLLLQTVPRPSDIEFVSSLECEITTATATAPVVFIKGLISVPFWETRLRSLKALREYEEESSSLYEEIALLSNAMKFLVQSTSLRSIFGSILFIGNQMNLGSARGSAKGFRLDAIAKLRSMKCNNNPHTSLLDFLVKQLSRNAAQALEFPQQIGPHLVNVKRAELVAIHQKIADLTSALERQSGASLAIAAKLPQGDSIHALSDSFKSALEDAESLRSRFSSLEDEAMRLLAYFGLTLDSAVSMFAELSPASQAAQSNKKQQEDNARRMWDTRKVDEVFAALSAAAMARRTHEDDPTSSDARYKREEGIKVARRLLCEWVTVLEWDEQSLRSPAVVSSAASEKVSQLSDVISKLFKLFKDFSEEFAGSVSMLVRLEQARRGRPRDDVRVQTSTCVPSLDEPSLEQVIGAAMQSRRRISESPSGRSDAASSAWSAD